MIDVGFTSTSAGRMRNEDLTLQCAIKEIFKVKITFKKNLGFAFLRIICKKLPEYMGINKLYLLYKGRNSSIQKKETNLL